MNGLSRIVFPLLEWYAQNKRVLPWRENTDAYRVWVSEIMLQQTRVEAVIPYYLHFLERFPTVGDLADAPEDDLLKMWEGLGYYSRARNLQKTARIVCEQFGGVFPSDFEQLLKLPGIGVYTAGAIASIAFEQPTPAVDGNVLRVLSRLTESRDDITDAAVKTRFTQQLTQIYPSDRRGDFTQSLMELGATVCVPNGPARCEQCPLAQLCEARIHGTQHLLPVKAPKQTRRSEDKTVLLLRCEQRYAVRRRAPDGLLGGLWEFPNLDGTHSAEQVRDRLSAHGIEVSRMLEAASKKHVFTHVEWNMRAFLIDCTAASPEFEWVTLQQLDDEITLPAAFAKFRKALEQ